MIVENNVFSCALQIDNAIPISNFFSDENDKELVFLEKYLMKKLVDSSDVRVENRNAF